MSGTGTFSRQKTPGAFPFLDVCSGNKSYMSSRVPGRNEAITQAPFLYLLANPGKSVRTALVDAFNVWSKVPDPQLSKIKNVIDELHTASLLIDDVEDSSPLRRGQASAHRVYGIAQTINSSNYSYFKAMQSILTFDRADVCVRIFNEEMLNLHVGQGLDIHWRDTHTCPSIDDYIDMVRNKTGGLIRMAVRFLSTCAHDSPQSVPSLIPLAESIGIFFQIRDDYLNLKSETYTKQKGLCEDLTEGKYSFPIIYALERSPESQSLADILHSRTTDAGQLGRALQIMEDAGSFTSCMDYLSKAMAKIRSQLDSLPHNTMMLQVMDRLAL